MTTQLHKPWARTRRARALAAASLLAIAALGTGILNATTASADAGAYTLVLDVPEALAPYVSSEIDTIYPQDSEISISCYVTGDTVSGQYGPSNVWDLVSGGTYAIDGEFVPDADVYTGSNSPVVPHCSTALGKTIGDDAVNVENSPGGGYLEFELPVGEQVEIQCYTTSSTSVPGPYGTENIWDKLPGDRAGGSPEWVPDALIYTGSNSAVVPHC